MMREMYKYLWDRQEIILIYSVGLLGLVLGAVSEQCKSLIVVGATIILALLVISNLIITYKTTHLKPWVFISICIFAILWQGYQLIVLSSPKRITGKDANFGRIALFAPTILISIEYYFIRRRLSKAD